MRSRHAQALLGITALGALLRFVTLGDQSYWGDEGVTVALIRMGFGDMLDTIPDSESTPPLYYALAWLWTRALGSSEEWGLRSLSAVAGTATIPVLYAATAQLVTRRAGLIAAALAACSPLLVWYSQESRAYALLALFTALTLWTFARALDDRPRALAWWAGAAALAVLTHYFAAFVVVPQAVWLIARAPAGRRAAALACVPVVAVGAALLPLALDQRATGNTAYIADIDFVQRAKEVPKKFVVGEQASPGDYGGLIEALKWPALLLALAGVALLVARGDDRERSGALIAGGLAVAGFAMPLALKLVGLDYLAAYNLQLLWLPVAIVVAAGFGARAAGWLGIAGAVALCAIGVAVVLKVATDEALHRYDYRGVAERLDGPARPRAIVASPLNSSAPFAAYLDGIDVLSSRAPVSDIAIVGMHSQDESTRARAFDQAYAPRVPGFIETERIDGDLYTLIRLEAPYPTPVDLNTLQAARLGEGQAALLLQP
jgi:4-amino-4-deoxy-L-arabinose transferase-like glycosyltransferase